MPPEDDACEGLLTCQPYGASLLDLLRTLLHVRTDSSGAGELVQWCGGAMVWVRGDRLGVSAPKTTGPARFERNGRVLDVWPPQPIQRM